jgi:hypothetical protein
MLFLTGCTATKPPPDGIQFRSDSWSLAAESGFAVAPFAAIPGIADPAEAAALFTNEFYAALLVSLPGTALTSPSETLGRINATGDDARSRIRSLRRKLYQNQKLAPEKLASISRDVQHRYLLVSWLDEDVSEGVQGGYDVYHRGQHEVVAGGYAYEEVKGQASAVVLDLWVNEILWRGMVLYETDLREGNEDDVRGKLDRTRTAAAVRLAGFFAEQ